MKPPQSKTARAVAVGCSALLGIVIINLSGCCNNCFGELPMLLQPHAHLGGCDRSIRNNVHELDAINDKGVERWNILGMAGCARCLASYGLGYLKLGHCYLQSKLPEMLPLLQSSGALRGSQSAPNANSGTKESGAGSDGGDKDDIAHIIIGALIGFLSAIGGYLIGVWTWLRLTMPNDPKLSHGERKGGAK